MIGLTVMNYRSGGRGKESSVVAAVCVFAFIAGLYPVLNYIPIAALVGIMFVVCIRTFRWSSVLIVAMSMLPRRFRVKLPAQSQIKVKRWDALIIVLVTLLTLNAFRSTWV
eukprot:GHVN01051561.1.p1 GENE.GHVN01051561.1~~GHVN01051561.1.p1  ORF type:complete len:111 (-),score=0.01 GHVN01051561.1:158-490(-)